MTFYQQSDVLKDLRSARKWVWNCIGSLAIYYTDWGKSLSALGVRNNGCGGGRHDFLSSLTVNRNYISMIHYRYRSYTQLVKRPVFCRRSYRLSSSRFTENRKYDSGGYLHNVANRKGAKTISLSVRLWCLSKHLNHMAVNASFRLNSIKILSSEHLGNVFCWHSSFKKPGYQEVYRDIFFCSLLVELLWWSAVCDDNFL